MLSESQRKARSKGLGGSDMPIICGISKFKTRAELYFEKIEETESPDLSGVSVVDWGNRLEPLIIRKYEEETGDKVFVAPEDDPPLIHPKHPWMLGNLDGKIIKKKKVLECKFSAFGHDYGPPGTDCVPDQYKIQVQWYLGVTGYERADLAALISGYDFRIYHIDRDEAMIETLIKIGENFWKNHVLKKVPPPPTVNEECQILWPKTAPPEEVVASEEVLTSYFQLKELKEKIKKEKKEQSDLEMKLKEHMKTSEILVMQGGSKLATWKGSVSKSFDKERFKKNEPDLHRQVMDKYIKETLGRKFLLK